jgi:hypothetical protein
MPTPPDIPGVPDQYQWLVYIIGGIGAVWSAVKALTAGRQEAERGSNPDVIVQGGSFVDMRPIKELNTNLEHLVNHTAAFAIAQRQTADALAEIQKIMKANADQDDVVELVERAILKQQMKDRKP